MAVVALSGKPIIFDVVTVVPSSSSYGNAGVKSTSMSQPNFLVMVIIDINIVIDINPAWVFTISKMDSYKDCSIPDR